MEERTKVLVVGIDGCTWNLLEPWIEQGYLPTLEGIKKKGCFGKLGSTYQMDSASAWASFATGDRPNKHGLAGFIVRDRSDHSLHIMNLTLLKSKPLWRILSEHGLRAGVINLPIAYPVEPLNGFMVGGMMTPAMSKLTYPPDLYRRLQSIGDYRIDISRSAFPAGIEGDELFSKSSLDALRVRGEVTKHLMKQQDWDVLISVFTETDRMQHYFWADMDPQHPRHSSTSGRFKNVILNHYKLVDEILAGLINSVPRNCAVFVVSDHGFAGATKRFYLNNWLKQKGYLVCGKVKTNNIIGLMRTISQRLPLGSRAKGRLFARLRKMLRGALLNHLPEQDNSFRWNTVDWSETLAYADVDRGIHINTRLVDGAGRYETLRNRIRQELLDFKDPQTGKSVISQVLYREQIGGNEKYRDSIPDLTVQTKQSAEDPISNYGELAVGPAACENPLLPLKHNLTATHINEGVFLASGRGIMNIDSPLDGINIIDIAPTILSLVGIDAFTRMDGRPLGEIMKTKSAPSCDRNAIAVDSQKHAGETAPVFDIAEKEAIEQKLRSLGYME